MALDDDNNNGLFMAPHFVRAQSTYKDIRICSVHYTHTCTHTHAHTRMHAYACTHTHTLACTHARAHAHTQTYTTHTLQIHALLVTDWYNEDPPLSSASSNLAIRMKHNSSLPKWVTQICIWVRFWVCNHFPQEALVYIIREKTNNNKKQM